MASKPGLYSNSDPNQGATGLYGQEPLSQRNQTQASQLGLPGATPMPGTQGLDQGHEAGSQIEAQSDWANFEDIFNKNRGYAQRETDAAKQQVADTYRGKAQPDLGAKAQSLAGRLPSAPAAQPQQEQSMVQGAMNPTAPAQLQASTLTGIQNRADVLKGYGPQQPQPALQQVSSKNQTLGSGGQQPTATSQSADTKGIQKTTGSKLNSSPSGVDANGNPINPFDYVPGQAPVQGQPGSTQTPPPRNPADANGDGTVSALEQAQYDKGLDMNGNPLPPGQGPGATPATPGSVGNVRGARAAAMDLKANPYDPSHPFSQSDLQHLSNMNQGDALLQGWATDDGKDLLQQIYGPEAGSWDAAIMATGGGRQALAQEQAQHAGKTDQFKQQLVNKANSQMQAHNAAQNAYNSIGKNMGASGGAPATQAKPLTTADVTSGSHKSYNSYEAYMGGDGTVMGDNGVKTDLHQISQQLDPASLAWVSAGENGVDMGPTPSEWFRNIFGSAFSGDTSELNNRIAMATIENKWGSDAAHWLWNNLSDSDWQGFNGHNWGYVEYLMKQKLGTAIGPDGKPMFHEGWQPTARDQGQSQNASIAQNNKILDQFGIPHLQEPTYG